VSVLPGQPVGRGLDVISTGWLVTATSDVTDEIFRGGLSAVFPSLHAGSDAL